MRLGTIHITNQVPPTNRPGAAGDANFPQNVQFASPDFFLSPQTTHPVELTATHLINRQTRIFASPASPNRAP